jgi:hypothetical protein
MNKPSNIRNVALVAALAAVAATAWAMNESLDLRSTAPATTVASTTSMGATQAAPAQAPVEPAKETVAPAAPSAAPSAPRPTPVADESVSQSRITIEHRRLSRDELIQTDVMDTLMRAPNLTGKIGVESHDAVVTLSGWTHTAGQAFRAGQYARGVTGVKYVQNDIRPRIGGSI